MRLRVLLAVPLAVLLCACPPSRDCDADRDGFEAPRCGGEDCNDATYLVNPDAAEICDGLDNDCDGDVDLPPPANPPTWYRDADGDTFGDADDTAAACDAPDGYVNNGLDCDDTRTLIRPGATEVCDGVDNDCDGEVDEDGAQFAPDWWEDADGDGYGDPDGDVVTGSCEAPAGYAGNRDDCDDADDAVHPGADEACDGVDNDCDGVLDALWWADADGDGFGDAAVEQDACDPGDGWVQEATDCDDSRDDVFPGAEEVCGDGVENSCDGLAAECGIAGVVDVAAAAAVTVAGRSVGHGQGRNLLAGESAWGGVLAAGAGWSAGDAFWFGDALDGATTTDDADATFAAPGIAFGPVAAGRDVTGDGIPDLLLGAPGDDRVYLIEGPVTDASSLEGAIVGDGGAGTAFGDAVALVPDLDGDGIDDIAVGAPSIGGGGRVFLFSGGPAPDLDAASSAAEIRGTQAWFGQGLAAFDDLDGDGLGELAVSAPYELDGGRVELYSGMGAGVRTFETDGIGEVRGAGGIAFGWEIANGGDLDGDGDDELLAAEGLWDEDDAFSIVGYVFSPAAGAILDAGDAHAVLGAGPTTVELTVDEFRATAVGDLDGDGAPGVALTWASAGEVVVVVHDLESFDGAVYEAADVEASLTGLQPQNGSISPALAGAGDLDGDGYDDLVVGEPGLDTEDGQDVGGFHVLLGGPGL